MLARIPRASARFTKLSSIASEGATALRSSTAFGWIRRVWIPQDCDPGESGNSFLEQLQPLCGELARHHREPGDVSARMREVRDQAGSDRIADDGHDDWDGGRGALDRLGRNRSRDDDYLDFALKQVRGQLWYPIEIAVGGSPLDHHIASLGVARV